MLPSCSPPEIRSAFTRPVSKPLSPVKSERSLSEISDNIDDLKLSISSESKCDDQKSCDKVECDNLIIEHGSPFLQLNTLVSLIQYEYQEKCRDLNDAQKEIEELRKQLESLHLENESIKAEIHKVNIIYQDRIIYQERIVPMGRIIAIDEDRPVGDSDVLHEFGI